MNRNLPRYRARTLFKDVLKEYPDIVDFTLPNLEGLTDESAGNIKHFLFDCLERHYRNSEIATYYADEFVGYFQDRWYTKVVKYVPLLKAKLTTENNVNIGEDFSANKSTNATDTAGKTTTETYSKDDTEETTYGRTVNNTIENTNNSTATSDETQNNTSTQNQDKTVGYIETGDTTLTGTQDTTYSSDRSDENSTTQYERQIVDANTTVKEATNTDVTNSQTTEVKNERTESTGDKIEKTDNNTRKTTDEYESTQSGDYNTTYGGKDSVTRSRDDTRSVENSGSDKFNEETNQTYLRKIYDYGRISAMISSPDIVDNFVGDFASLFMEVFV